jgi:PucR C-terminal helix-turn-helix domain/GGDEF-like domain
MSETRTPRFPLPEQIATGLLERAEEITAATLERVWANPALERWTRDDTRAAAGDIARASIARELEALGRGELPAECPDEDLAAARAAVAYGAPVTVVLHCYRAGQAAILDACLDSGAEADALAAVSAFTTAYVDRCAAWVELEHSLELERTLRSDEQRRMDLVRELLAGADADAEALGYDVHGTHCAAIAWGPSADAAARLLRGAADGGSLTLSVDPVTTWSWLAVAAVPVVEPPQGARVALGGPAAGLDGFRRAHAQAQAARRVGEHGTQPVLRYGDLALEALALCDEQDARDFVAHELGPLLHAGKRGQVLLATLEAYFVAAGNAVSAGAALGVHDRTVANRLRAVEELLGPGAVVTRRAELETALRLQRLLEPER